jgi:hypothetical protein
VNIDVIGTFKGAILKGLNERDDFFFVFGFVVGFAKSECGKRR